MASSPVAQYPQKTSKYLLTFRYGDPVQEVRLTDWTAPVELRGGYDSMPDMDLKLPEDSLGLHKSGVEVTISSDHAFAQWLTDGYAKPEVSLEVSEILGVSESPSGSTLLDNGSFSLWTYTDLLANGDFESRTGDNFDTWTEVASGSSTITADATGGPDGSCAARLTIDSSNSSAYLRQTVGSITAGTSYRVKFWAKIDSVGVGGDHLHVWAGGGSPTAAYVQSITLTAEWAEYEVEVEAVSGGTYLYLRRGGSAASKSIWIDKVEFAELPPTPDDWTVLVDAGASISPNLGGARIYAPAGQLSTLQQTVAMVAGQVYSFSYRIRESVVGSLKIKIGASEEAIPSSVGDHVHEFIADGTTFEISRSGITDVTIDSCALLSKGANESLEFVRFTGLVATAEAYPNGDHGVIKIVGLPTKGMMDLYGGIPLTNQCAWILGEGKCGVDVDALSETALVDSIDGLQITFDSLATTTAGYWHRGFVSYDGLNIGVRIYTTGTSMELVALPPTSWVGKTVTLIPGCDGTIETCRSKFDSEETFGGAGYAIPSVNPILEIQ